MRQNIETKNRIDDFISRIDEFQSERRIAPEIRSKLCLVELCNPKINDKNLAKDLRALLVDCPFDQNDPRNVNLILTGWQSYIRSRFDFLAEKESASSAWELIFKELCQASRGSPISQV